MKSYHVISQQEAPEIRMIPGSIVLVFDPKEIEVAVWVLEHLATVLEDKARQRCGTDEMWEMSLKLRKYHGAAGKFIPPYKGLNGV